MRVDLAVFRRVPRWVSVIFGLACVLVGAVLVVRPFASLSVLAALAAAALLVTGVMELAAAPGGLIRSSRRAVAGWFIAPPPVTTSSPNSQS